MTARHEHDAVTHEALRGDRMVLRRSNGELHTARPAHRDTAGAVQGSPGVTSSYP